MAKPFSDLEERAIAILASGGDPLQSADTAVASYWRWKINPSAQSHNLPTASERPNGRKLQDVYVEPFSFSLPTGTFAQVSISNRAKAVQASLLSTQVGYKALSVDQVGYGFKGFKPAKVYFRTGAATTSAQRTSRITGRTYKSYYAAADEGFSMPFGKLAASDTQYERQTAIKAALEGGTEPINLISFTPEKARV